MRARLSQAAYEVIAESGHSAFRTAMVANRAGVSQGALAHHFATKDAVTLAAVERAFIIGRVRTDKLLSQTFRGIEECINAMQNDFREFFFRDPFWVALDIVMDASKSATLAPAIRRIVASHRKPVYGLWTAKLVALGWTHERAAEAVKMSQAFVSGMAIRTLWTDDGNDESINRHWINFLMQPP